MLMECSAPIVRAWGWFSKSLSELAAPLVILSSCSLILLSSASVPFPDLPLFWHSFQELLFVFALLCLSSLLLLHLFRSQLLLLKSIICPISPYIWCIFNGCLWCDYMCASFLSEDMFLCFVRRRCTLSLVCCWFFLVLLLMNLAPV